MEEQKNYPGRKFKKPSDAMLKYYADLFLRNQSKWIRKSMLKPEALGSKFVHERVEYELVGSVSPKEFLIKNNQDEFFLVLSQIVDAHLLPK